MHRAHELANPVRDTGAPLKILEFFNTTKQLSRLQREVKALREDNARLQEKADSMRQGMRRCVTCEYRTDYKERVGKAPILQRAWTESSLESFKETPKEASK